LSQFSKPVTVSGWARGPVDHDHVAVRAGCS
jgi:hypothetical protein